MPPLLFQFGITVNSLRIACFSRVHLTMTRRIGLLATLFLLSACQSGPGGRAVFQRIDIEAMAAPGGQLALVDVGGDLAPDIVLMSQRPGRVHWYENPSWAVRQIPVVADELYGMAAAPSMQSDAGAGLALNGRFSQPGAGTRHQLIWLENPGRTLPDQPWPVSVLRADAPPGRLFAADLSGAGQVLPISLPGFEVFARTAVRSRWTSMPLIENTPANARVRVFDWDLNGRDDLLVMSDRGLEILALASRWRFVDQLGLLAASGDGGYLDVGVGQSGRPARRFMATLSLDGTRLQVFRPDPETGTRWLAQTLSDTLDNARVLKVADLNRDAFDEIVVGTDAGLLVYYYDGAQSLWHRYQIDGTPVADIAIADLNGNGMPDMVTAPAQAGVVRLFQNRGRSN